MASDRTRTNAGLLAAIVLLVFMAVLSFGAALQESPTFDEIAHIGAGLSYVQKFDLRLNPEHPPLAKALSGLALTLRGIYADYSGPAWTYSKDFVPAFLAQWSFGQWVIARWNTSSTVLFWARLPMLFLTLGLGWIIFVLARRLGTMAGGLLCLAAYVSAPVFLAFGPLVVTDIAIAFFSVLSIGTFADLWQSPTRANRWRFTLSLAGAFLSKFSAPILLLGLLVAGFSTRWLPLDSRAGRKPWLPVGKSVLWTVVLVYGVYLVLSWNQPTDALHQIGTTFPALVLRRLLLPLVTYLGGAVLVLFTFNRLSFVLGHAYPHGVWFYYPVVFALKSQLAFLALLLMSGIAGLTRGGKVKSIGVIPAEYRMLWRTIWVTLVIFVAVCMLSRFDISVRHFSVPMAILILLVAPLPRLIQQHARIRTSVGRGAIAVLVLSCLFNAVRQYPWYFPYVNALSAGRPAYALLADSNVDWNQALPEVQRFAERQGVRDLALDSFGISDDTVYVPHSHVWDCQAPQAADAGQWVVVSANMIFDSHNCSWLLRYSNEQLAGGSMYAFHLPGKLPAAGEAGGPPRTNKRRMFLGAPFDFKAAALKTARHPETIPSVVALVQKQAR